MEVPKLSEMFRGKIRGLPDLPGFNEPIDLKGAVNRLEDKATKNIDFKAEKIGFGITKGNPNDFRMNKIGLGMKQDNLKQFGINKIGLGRATQETINFRTDKLGFKRIQQQKGLSLFGDYDKDKVKNVFDCDPYDRMKQGFLHKTMNLVKGKGFRENEEIPVSQYTYDEAKPNVEQNEQIEYDNTHQSSVQPFVAQQAEQEKPAWKEFLYGAGVLKTEEHQIALRKAKQQQQYASRDAKQERDILAQQTRHAQQIEKLKSKTELERERIKKGEKKETPVRQLKTVSKQFGGAKKDIEQGFFAFRQGYSGAGTQFREPPSIKFGRLMGMGAIGQQFQETSATKYGRLMGIGGQSYSDKVQNLMGMPSKKQSLMGEKVQQVQPQSYAQPQPQYGQPQPQYGQPQPPSQPQYPQQIEAQPTGPPPEPGMSWSAKSKRWVKYERRPYRKRIPATYQQGY